MPDAPQGRLWKLSDRVSLALDPPRLMAILNLTPDSFSDGGAYPTTRAATDAAARAVDDGADVLDLGGESTRPGARPVPADEQVRRVVPVIRAIRAAAPPLGGVPISIDTTSSLVARAALDEGADAINDVSAGLDDADMFDFAAVRGAGLVLMHRLRPPAQDAYSDSYPSPPVYRDVVLEVREFLAARLAAAVERGIAPHAILLDPGLGFGKSVEQNLELIARTPELLALGRPILSGLSRKSFVGRAAGLEGSTPTQRLPATIALSVLHMLAGAAVFRIHDVRAHKEALHAARTLGSLRR